MKTIIIMLFAILSVADASAEKNGKYEWTDEKAKSLGFPLVPIGTVVLCESEESVGFNWKNGTYVSVKFKNKKRILKKAEASKCPLLNEFYTDHLFDDWGGRKVCIQHKKFGGQYYDFGGVCSEIYSRTHFSLFSFYYINQ